MKILWLCNIMLPVIAESLGLPASNKEGWLSGLSGRLLRRNEENMTLAVCFPVSDELIKEAAGDLVYGAAGGLVYYGFPEDTEHPERYDARTEEALKRIIDDFEPDIVHCFGTEYPHTLAMTRAFGRPERTLIGIQGLCFVYADAYMADLPEHIMRRTMLRDYLKKDNLLQQQEKYRRRGEYETEALRNVAHVTGRTDWDKNWTNAVNPKAAYHFMNETLREPFYGPKWDVDNCERYSIFLSQGNYPIKGLHYMLQALPHILQSFPHAHVYVAGDEITRFASLKEKLKISGYGKYLLELIKSLHLEGKVTFLGRLSAEEMLERFLKSNVFVSPSAIENSPNSVGEAMLLGMPVVSSDVGGVHNMLLSGREGLLYPSPDISALAEAVCHMLDPANQAEVLAMGRAARERAMRTHDPEINYHRLMEIYYEINLCV